MRNRFPRLTLVCLIPLCFLSFASCWEDKDSQVFLELSLYTGIPGVARLGETYQQVTQHADFPHTKLEMAADTDLGKLGFTDALYFKAVGAKVFFKRTGVSMITAQEPFKGSIKSKNVKLFAFSVPPVSDWEELLIKEFGQPDARAAGGRFSSEALFYNWGDISYNRMGPNEIALYRDPEVSKFRMNHFGREVSLFPEKKK